MVRWSTVRVWHKNRFDWNRSIRFSNSESNRNRVRFCDNFCLRIEFIRFFSIRSILSSFILQCIFRATYLLSYPPMGHSDGADLLSLF